MAGAAQDSVSEVLELHQVLETMIENVDNMSVELTCMAYDMVVLVTSPELLVGLEMLESAYLRCRSAVHALRDQVQDMDRLAASMENVDSSREQATSTASTDLESILKGLDSLSRCMDQLALRTQLRQCDLIVCVGHPDKSMCLKDQEAPTEQQQQHQRPA